MKTRIVVAGDMLVQRRLCPEREGFAQVAGHIQKADARFFNLETTLHRGEHFANQYCGGSYLRADPEVLEDARLYGFNMLSFANNHAMDFSHGGLLATKKAVQDSGFVHAGCGANLDEAAAPAYLETPNGRVALISAVATMVNEAAMAGKQSRRYPGRPGVNGLRVKDYLQVTPEQMQVIQTIGQTSKINAREEIKRAEGYEPPLPKDVYVLKDLQFKLGEETKYVTSVHPEDMARIEKTIYEAQMQSDCILVSVHSHELSGSAKENPGDFLVEFAHRCIDAGAHAVIGHGPHLLRPIEIYKNRPIFYSLGDFILQNECIPYAPEEMYAKQKLTSDATMRELFCDRSANYTRGLMRDRRMLESVVPYFEFEDGQLTHLELMPIELGFDQPVWRNGNPRFSKDHGIIQRLAELCAPYGTKITEDDRGYGIVELGK